MTSFLPLQLHIQEGTWRLYATRKHDKNFVSFRDSIFKRDDYMCQYCGFRANRHLDVVNVDGNYRNNRSENLVTACPMCSQCHFLEMVGKTDHGDGALIYMPELSQNKVNAISHICFCAIAGNTHFAPTAQSILAQLRKRSRVVDEKLGEGMSSPKFFAQMIIDTPFKNKEEVVPNLLKDLRLLPSQKQFATLIDDWTRDAIEAMKEDK